MSTAVIWSHLTSAQPQSLTTVIERREDMVEQRRMRTGRCDMAWLEAGAGWPVILLHGFPLNAEIWRPQLEAVPDGWRFIAPDFRGFGGTRALEQDLPAEGGSLDQYAADIGD